MLYLTPDDEGLATAARLLDAGRLVALPTETVYGLAADAANPDALREIFRAKGRPVDHPLILHLAGVDQLREWVTEVPPIVRQLAAVFWPGPLTLILVAGPRASSLITGGQTTLAVRVPSHPVMQAVLRRLGRGVAAPSANPYGQVSPTTSAHVQRHLTGRIAAVVDGGPCQIGIESTILDLTAGEPAILRPGAITAAMLAPYVQLAESSHTSGTRAPGGLPRHYAPCTPCYRIAAGTAARPDMAGRVGLLAQREPRWPVAHFWPMPDTPDDFARVFYAALHAADASGCDALLVALPPDGPEWRAVHDRILRATRPLPPAS
ncbi:L-threonylcarbamoyladenylate synthase [Thioalkalicoccus limnaeus]|uniref:Threonylcarbamoyl-AMP synthase n=1 Tax=Thioalkalicoccus limnaeus TaxID=120681 RepID=A0ABV4BBC9_9GAMM